MSKKSEENGDDGGRIDSWPAIRLVIEFTSFPWALFPFFRKTHIRNITTVLGHMQLANNKYT